MGSGTPARRRLGKARRGARGYLVHRRGVVWIDARLRVLIVVDVTHGAGGLQDLGARFHHGVDGVIALPPAGAAFGQEAALGRQRRSDIMKFFVGLDVSLEETAICLVDADGIIVAEGKPTCQLADIPKVREESELPAIQWRRAHRDHAMHLG